MLERLKKRKLKHFSYAVVAYYAPDTTYNGKSIEQINLMKGRKHKAKEEAETVIDIMMNGGASAVFHGMSEEDVKRIMQYPFNMFASDAIDTGIECWYASSKRIWHQCKGIGKICKGRKSTFAGRSDPKNDILTGTKISIERPRFVERRLCCRHRDL